MVFWGPGVIMLLRPGTTWHHHLKQTASIIETFVPSCLAGWLAGWAGFLLIFMHVDSFSWIWRHNVLGPGTTWDHLMGQAAVPIETFVPSWLVGWLAGWLVGWLVGWLAGWLAGSLGWLAGWLAGWLVLGSWRPCAQILTNSTP